MSNEGGCSHQYPGIGNISYVKDLMTRKIATRNFNCSRFGASIARGLGWVCSQLYLYAIFNNFNHMHDFNLKV
jgi:hypothetical protein